MEINHDGITANWLINDGFDANELYKAGFKIREELQQLNNDILQKTGLTVSDFFNKAKTLKDKGYSIQQLKDGGYTMEELVEAGWVDVTY